ncbi:MAG: hypothetical protein ACOCVF_00275 [bacterium]
MFGLGFLAATIIWIGLIEWRTSFFSTTIKLFFNSLWNKFKLKVKNIVNGW